MTSLAILGRARLIATRPIVVSGGATVLIQLGNVLTGVILARALGPAVRGHVAAMSALALSMSVIVAVSLTDAAMYVVARNGANRRAAISSFFVVLTLTMAVVTVLLLAAAPVLMWLGGTPSFADVLPWILCAGLTQSSAFFQTLARSLDRFWLWFSLRVLGTWAYAVALLAFTFTTGLTIQLAGIGLCLAAAITAAVGAAFMFREIFPLKPSREIAGQLLRYGLKMHPATVASISRDQLDKVILILLVAPSEVGKYVVAIALCSFIVSAGYSVDQAIFPRLAGILDFSERRSTYLRMIRQLSPLFLLAAPVLLVISPTLVSVLFGRRFADQPWLIVAGAGLGLLNTVKILASVGLKIENRPGRLGFNDALGSVIGLAVLPFAVKLLGIMGAPLASGFGAVVALTLTLHALSRQYAKPLGA